MSIPVIDIFAGPGGLAEGFSSVKDKDGNPAFDIRLSIEKDENAHKTLVWRSYYRQFLKNGLPVPDEYYTAMQVSNIKERESRIEEILNKTEEGKEARIEARKIELGAKKFPPSVVERVIKERLGDSIKDNWVLIGGPPCQAYSNAGRSRVGGIDPKDHRVYLYREYLRIIQEHEPSIFVMENVRGLLSAKVNGIRVFDQIIEDLKCDGLYSIHSFVKEVEKDSDFLIKAEDYGVPQKRHRVIILGLRNDFSHSGSFLKKDNANKINVKSVIENLPKVRSALNREFIEYDFNNHYKNGNPKRIYQNLKDTQGLWLKYRSDHLSKIEAWGELDVPEFEKDLFEFPNQYGAEFISIELEDLKTQYLNNWYQHDNEKLGGVLNHESRSHLTQDLIRYLFSTIYLEKMGDFPRLEDYVRHSDELVPDHKSALSGNFSDRFRVQEPDLPATTITSHISKDGHYFIHYDPAQCRSLTVREAARIQTFPDNYLFRGSRTSQYVQVGNAVPPLLAKKIGDIVYDIIE